MYLKNSQQKLSQWIAGGKYVYLRTEKWFIENRMKTILMRSQEYGLMKYFESLSQRTFKQITTEMRSHTLNSVTMVATAGGLQEILIACAIYLIGTFCGIVTFIVEYFSTRYFS